MKLTIKKCKGCGKIHSVFKDTLLCVTCSKKHPQLKMTYISGNTKQLLILLEAAFAAGFSAGYPSVHNPASHEKEWEDYKKEYLTEYESEHFWLLAMLACSPDDSDIEEG